MIPPRCVSSTAAEQAASAVSMARTRIARLQCGTKKAAAVELSQATAPVVGRYPLASDDDKPLAVTPSAALRRHRAHNAAAGSECRVAALRWKRGTPSRLPSCPDRRYRP